MQSRKECIDHWYIMFITSCAAEAEIRNLLLSSLLYYHVTVWGKNVRRIQIIIRSLIRECHVCTVGMSCNYIVSMLSDVSLVPLKSGALFLVTMLDVHLWCHCGLWTENKHEILCWIEEVNNENPQNDVAGLRWKNSELDSVFCVEVLPQEEQDMTRGQANSPWAKFLKMLKKI